MKQTKKGAESIKGAWRLACEHEGINPRSPTRIPLLFVLNSDLDIPSGFKYSLDCTKRGSHPYCGSHIGCSGGGCGAGHSSHNSCLHNHSICGGSRNPDAGGVAVVIRGH